MIGKVSRGDDTAGLLRYLFGPGRANEHTNPHVVAGWDETVLADGLGSSRAGIKRMAALLEQPLATLNSRPSPAVWHCSLRAAPGDRRLTDAEWADVAAEVLDRTGLAPRDDPDGCRWVAVRHAEDHIHLAVTLARQDGRRARTPHDYVRVGAACRAVEERYGLTVTPARDRTAPKRPTRAESEKALRQGLPEAPRQQLRRQVRRAALSTTDLDTFVEQLQAAGVQVRLRHSELDPSVVTGYAVADAHNLTADGELVWFGGGKLAPQLSLPRLTLGWQGRGTTTGQFLQQGRHLGSRRRGTPTVSVVLQKASAAAAHAERGNFAAAAAAALATATQVAFSGRRRSGGARS